MSNDFRIDIAPNGPDLRFTLYRYNAGMPDVGMSFDRVILNLPDTLISRMRRGVASPVEVSNITATVSEWLYGNDIGPQLQIALSQQNAELLRLIFSINDPQLREKLADVPLELSRLNQAVLPLVLQARNAAIIHLLPKVGTPPTFTSSVWPLRILVVRSNPGDLGGAVPAANELRQGIYNILDNTPGLNRNLVQVHVLSSENAPDLAGRPTRENFRKQLTRASYDILVYLGHGDVLPAYTGLMPIGVLQLESEDGSAHVSVPADQLAVLLHERPVPVVLLIGCLTAAEVDKEIKEGVENLTPQWMRGSQGLAQALVNSESGVQLALGMRYLLETRDAMQFLNAFFNHLLASDQRGNVESAVHMARIALNFGAPPGSYNWSAPMIFRTLLPEPMFSFLNSPPPNTCPTVQQSQDLRDIFWRNLSQQAWSRRPQNGAGTVHNILKDVDRQIVQSILAQAPSMIMPAFQEARSAETVTVPIELYGNLNIDELRGRLVIGSQQLTITSIQATPDLIAKGYDVLSAINGNQAKFLITRDGAANGGLHQGILFYATIQLDAASQVVYPVSVDIISTVPNQAVCSSINAIIVPPP
jgi:hypothetical protein